MFTLTTLALSVFNFVTMGVCLYLATLLVGYNITVKEILAIAVICSAVRHTLRRLGPLLWSRVHAPHEVDRRRVGRHGSHPCDRRRAWGVGGHTLRARDRAGFSPLADMPERERAAQTSRASSASR